MHLTPVFADVFEDFDANTGSINWSDASAPPYYTTVNPSAVGSSGNGLAICSDLINGFTRQQVIVSRTLGSSLKSALAHFASGSTFGYAISGMTFDFGHPGASNIKVNGAALSLSSYYTVAAQAYVMQTVLNYAPGATVVTEMNGTTREALFNYVQTQGTINAPTTGRVKRL